MKRTIGLFGGTFDPIHLGHLNLALELKEKCQLDEVWFIPALNPPLRPTDQLAKPSERLEMVKLAVQPISDFKVVALEFEREGLSYTIDTVKRILDTNKGDDFVLLLGEDSAMSLPRWKEALELVRLIPLCVGCRTKINLTKKIKNPLFPKEIRLAVQKGIVETAMMDIEGKMIRKRLKEKLYCGHLLPAKVLDFISENHIYYYVS